MKKQTRRQEWLSVVSQLGVGGSGVQSQPELQTAYPVFSYISDILPEGRFLWLFIFVFNPLSGKSFKSTLKFLCKHWNLLSRICVRRDKAKLEAFKIMPQAD